MIDKPFSETRAARLCSWILYAAVLVYTAWMLIRILMTREPFRNLYADLGAQPSVLFSLVTHPVFLGALPAAVLIGFVKEIRIHNKTRTMIWNGMHLILLLLIFGLYMSGLLQTIDVLSGGAGKR